MLLLRRLKPACPGRLLPPPSPRTPMDPGHILAELVIARFIDHQLTIVGPVCVITYCMHRRVTLTQFFAIW